MLDRATGVGDFVGTHRRVADDDHLMVVAEFVQDVESLVTLGVAAAIVLPYALVKAIMEVEMFKMLELGARGGE